MPELIFDASRPGRPSPSYTHSFPASTPEGASDPLDETIPRELRREAPPILPSVSELDVVRHFNGLSRMNMSVDSAMYPLGSCTMKYNPRIADEVASAPGFTRVHPLQEDADVQGCLEVMMLLQDALAELTGLDAVTLTPAAGAHGELMGLLIIRALLASRDESRHKVLVPDSAHGTNPASVSGAGWTTVTVPSGQDGCVDLDAFSSALDRDVAAIMLTVPNTHGLFEPALRTLADMAHANGSLVYWDGANMNALLGIASPGELGADLCHLNLHKTFATPHGGGGPGAGALCVSSELEPFLPVPRVIRDHDGFVRRLHGADLPFSIGRMRGFSGNFANLVRALSYILGLGKEGISRVGPDAMLSAAYMLRRLVSEAPAGTMSAPFGESCMHEFVVSLSGLKESRGVRALDVAKRLLDHGVHPPTVYFPLTVPEDLLLEPTETESLATMDAYADALLSVLSEAVSDPETVMSAPHSTAIGRLDETAAARNPIVREQF